MPHTIDRATQRRATYPLDSNLLEFSDVTGRAGFGCSVLRRARIKVFVLCPDVKEVVCVGERWETTPCTAPLLSPSERETRVCESCAAGWEVDMNRLATPEEVAEYEALKAGGAEERRRGISAGQDAPDRAGEERDQRLYAVMSEASLIKRSSRIRSSYCG